MKNISRWAKANRPLVILLVILLNFLLLFDALLLGILTYCFDIRLPLWMVYIFGHLFFLLFCLYPIKNHKMGWFKQNYYRQKTCDFFMAITAILCVSAGVNQFAYAPDRNMPLQEVQAQFIVYTPSPQQGKHVTKNKKSIVKKWKKQVKEQLKTWKKQAKETSVGTQVVLLFLTFIGMLLLAAGLAMLVCSIACSGFGAFAAVILIVGVTGLIWAVMTVVKRILSMRERKPKTPSSDMPIDGTAQA